MYKMRAIVNILLACVISGSVKPHPVIGLTAFVQNSTCIRLQWRTNNSEMQYPKEYTVRLIVSSKWEDPQVLTFNTTEDTEKDIHGKTFCDLNPHTVYTFSVSIQPTGEQAGFYSDPRETEAATFSDIPSASPSVTKGGYSWTPRDCEATNAKRQVCVFWKPIQEEDKNGQMKGLDGTFTAVNHASAPIDVNWAVDLTYGCSAGLLCNTSYIFSIKARNNNGTSIDRSALLISASTLEIVQPKFIVEAASSSNVSVSWEETEEATGYIVAWCRNKNGYCEKRNKVYWQNFSSKTGKAYIEINQENSPKDFLYGVGVLTEQGSSGVEWQDCVYLKNADLKRRPLNVVVSAGSEDNTLVVTWDKLACKLDEPYIAKYRLQYNKVNDRNKKAIDVPASGEARVVLKGLEEKQTYIVTVRGITKDGHYGPKSQPKKGVPVDNRLKPGAIIGSVISVLLGVLIAAIGCVHIRKCKKTAKKNIKQLGDITTTEDTNLRLNETVKENDTDRMSSRSISIVSHRSSNYSCYDPITPPFDKLFDRPCYGSPDQYCLASVGNGQKSKIGNNPHEQVSVDTSSNDYVTETNAGSSVDYVEAQPSHFKRNSPYCCEAEISTITSNMNSNYFQGQLPEDEIQNKRNEDNENMTDKVSRDISFQPLTNMPRPISIDESDTSSIDEENVSSHTHTEASASPQVPQSGTNDIAFSVVEGSSVSSSASEGNVSCPDSLQNLVPTSSDSNYVSESSMFNSPVKNKYGYVISTDYCATPSSMTSAGTDYVDSLVNKTDSNLTEKKVLHWS